MSLYKATKHAYSRQLLPNRSGAMTHAVPEPHWIAALRRTKLQVLAAYAAGVARLHNCVDCKKRGGQRTGIEVVPLVAGAAPIVVRGPVVGLVVRVLRLLVIEAATPA